MDIIRLRKRGRKHLPMYDIVVANKGSKRDGKYIEKLGTYNPTRTPSEVRINEKSVIKWLKYGAQISETVRSILSNAGIMLKWHLEQGIIKGKINEEKKNEKFLEWKKMAANKKKKTFNFTFIGE